MSHMPAHEGDGASPTLSTRIDALLSGDPYAMEPSSRRATLLALLKDELSWAAAQHPGLRRYYESWPTHWRHAQDLSELPYLPVGMFKVRPALRLVPQSQIVRVLASSATTGQTPSQVVLDAPTSKRMARGVTAIVRSFIGPQRRPYLVIDTPSQLAAQPELGARGAAIQGLRAFASQVVSALAEDAQGGTRLDLDALMGASQDWAQEEVLIYGFTHVLWQSLVLGLRAQGLSLQLPRAWVLHSGGWKRLQDQSVSPQTFVQGLAEVVGCEPARVLDFYGMVENVGVIYPDCEHGLKHVPAFADLIIRDPLSLAPVEPLGMGLVQVCSALPTSFPGHCLLTEDIGQRVLDDGCGCGRRGPAFRFIQRAAKAEPRGCANIETSRSSQKAATHA